MVTATFSADSGHVIAAFSAGNLGIFNGVTLQPLQNLALAVLCAKPGDLRPTALAAQPAVPGTDAKPCRLAVGFNDCSVALLEPSGALSWEAPTPDAAATSVSPEQKQAQPAPVVEAPVESQQGHAQEAVTTPTADPADAPADDGVANAAEQDGLVTLQDAQ